MEVVVGCVVEVEDVDVEVCLVVVVVLGRTKKWFQFLGDDHKCSVVLTLSWCYLG